MEPTATSIWSRSAPGNSDPTSGRDTLGKVRRYSCPKPGHACTVPSSLDLLCPIQPVGSHVIYSMAHLRSTRALPNFLLSTNRGLPCYYSFAKNKRKKKEQLGHEQDRVKSSSRSAAYPMRLSFAPTLNAL